MPGLWKRGDRATAILLSAYADNIGNGTRRDYAVVGEIPYRYDDIYGSITVDEMRKSNRYFNFADYSSLSFQLMGILSSVELAAVYNRIFTNNGPIYTYLRRLIRQDSDFYNELIGTLAIREENYIRAENYLSKVSDRYMRTTNIDKRGYLSRDPFVFYPSRWKVYSLGEFSEDYEIGAARHHRKSNPKAKLEFARKMKAYRNTIEHGKSTDERGLARLMYAIGLYNSFEECWALTQYWRGWVSRFKPDLDYWSEDNEDYKFLERYEEITDHHRSEEIYKRETEAALAMLRSDEAKARAHYILGNLKTIVSLYPRSATAHHVKTSCDRWRTWL